MTTGPEIKQQLRELVHDTLNECSRAKPGDEAAILRNCLTRLKQIVDAESNWIAVSDRLPVPPLGQPLALVWGLHYSTIREVWYSPSKKKWVDCCGNTIRSITHWHKIEYPKRPLDTTPRHSP